MTSHHSSTGARLDDLLASRFLPKSWAARVWSAADLPIRLQHCANNLGMDSEWRAYRDDSRIFFAIARANSDKSRQPSEVSIDVYFLDDSGAVYAAGVWEHDPQHGWWLDALLELSYDPEHGWWLDKLMESPASAPNAGALPPALAFTHVIEPTSWELTVRPRAARK